MTKSYFILAISLLSFSVFAQPNISLNTVITGLNQPMQFVNAGDGSNRIFIPQKGGEIKVFDRNFMTLGTFLTVTGISTGGEQGLLSLCFHPQYKTNGLFFVYYTTSTGDLEVARFKVRGGDTINVANPASKKVVITIPHPTYSNHNGGTLRFGKDGFLYLSTGDGGSGGDPSNNSQSNNLLGKMLRINVNTSNTPPFYSIPAGNISGTEILAKGLRNPFRWNFDRLTGDMWIGDVGQNAFEEISRVHRDSMQVNFGWRCYEGNAAYNTTGCLPSANYRFPVVAYPNPAEGKSVVGGTVYRGETFLAMKGYYLGVDFYTGKLFKIKFDSLAYTYNISTQTISPNTISDFGESEDGEMYVTCLNNGNIYRVISDGSVLQYTFTGNGNWTDATNWSNNLIPSTSSPSGSVIVISPVAGGECVVNVPVSISAGMKIKVENSKLLRMSTNLRFQ